MSRLSATDRIDRVILAAYPPSFRHRYGEELAALVDDTGSRWGTTFDLGRGAVLAWMRPAFAGDRAERRRSRLQATVATTFAAWASSVVAAGAFDRGVNDPPLFGSGDVAHTGFTIAGGVARALAVAALVAGLAYWLMIVVPAVRARRRAIWLPASVPAAIVAGWAAVSAALAFVVPRLVSDATPHASPGRVVVVGSLLVAYVALTLAAVTACVASVCVAIRRAHLGSGPLTLGVGLSSAAALALAAQFAAACVCIATIDWSRQTPSPLGLPLIAQSVVPLAILFLSAVAAGVSVWRGVRAVGWNPGSVA